MEGAHVGIDRGIPFRLGLAAAVLAVAVVFVLPAVAQQPLPDAAVKAAFLTKFPEFVDWPPAVEARRDALALCLSPTHPFGRTVRDLARDLTVDGRPVVVRELRATDPLIGCDVLFVAPPDTEFLHRADRLPILTVGDQEGFCQRGGVVNFRVIDGRVRFEISVAQARRAGLNFDSQLLRLAVAVHGAPR